MSERFDCLRSLASQDYGAKTIARPPDSQETKTGELPLSWGMFQKNDFRERRLFSSPAARSCHFLEARGRGGLCLSVTALTPCVEVSWSISLWQAQLTDPASALSLNVGSGHLQATGSRPAPAKRPGSCGEGTLPEVAGEADARDWINRGG